MSKSALRDLKTIASKVEYILEHHPKTRSNDSLLALGIYWTFYNINKDTLFVEAFQKIADNDLPCIESIGRSRRKIQEAGKFLAPENVQRTRAEMSSEVRQQILSW